MKSYKSRKYNNILGRGTIWTVSVAKGAVLPERGEVIRLDGREVRVREVTAQRGEANLLVTELNSFDI